MVEKSTIWIADISGFTRFLSQSILEHSASIVQTLLECIVESDELGFVVAEIEGDAVLFYKKGSAIDKNALIKQCLTSFEQFHNLLRKMKREVECDCVACSEMGKLSLKFVVHYGDIHEIRVSGFTKASGMDMIIAHRLLKNNIPSNQYILTTKSYTDNFDNIGDTYELSWQKAIEEYPSIEKVAYEYTVLSVVSG